MLKELLEIKIKRVGSSPYFHQNFITDEKKSLESISRVKMLECNLDPQEIKDSSIIISNTQIKFNHASLDLFKSCSLILHSNSGYDNFEFDFINSFAGDILIGNPIRREAVASFILSAFFNHFSAIPNQTTWDKNRKYNRKSIDNLNVQLIGHGAIGKTIAKSLSAFNLNLKIYDPYLNLQDEHQEKIDALILCCGHNQSNHNFINHTYLEKLNKDAVIINPARGELIHTGDLINFLDQNKNAFAYLDVFENEPADFSIFKNISNINTTSHIAGVFNGIEEKTIAFEKTCIEDFLTLNEIEFRKKYSHYLLKNKIIGNQII
jgi:phosphoglycerate dehydrogenase-like enzyme